MWRSCVCGTCAAPGTHSTGLFTSAGYHAAAGARPAFTTAAGDAIAAELPQPLRDLPIATSPAAHRRNLSSRHHNFANGMPLTEAECMLACAPSKANCMLARALSKADCMLACAPSKVRFENIRWDKTRRGLSPAAKGVCDMEPTCAASQIHANLQDKHPISRS